MKIKKIVTEVEVYDDIEDLVGNDEMLLEAAKLAMNSAYAPYSKFYVGAALLLENGKIVTGSNQENASYPLGLCAERVAIFAAGAQYPNIPIKSIAVTVKNPKKEITGIASPCGGCRQVMAEAEQRYKVPMRIILQSDRSPVYIFKSVLSILPLAFDSDFL